MTILNDILSNAQRVTHATNAGRHMHQKLQRIMISDSTATGDAELIARIRQNDTLARLFDNLSRTEVPVAGTIYNRFVSRRIDRLRIDDTAKTVDILDYKTDTDKTVFYDKYMAQVREYMALLARLYPDYMVRGHILWTHDFEVESVA